MSKNMANTFGAGSAHRDIALYAMEALLKSGAGKAACKITRGRKDEFNVEAGDFSLMRTLFSDSLSLKALIDNRKGVTVINKLDRESIDQAVADCIALAGAASPDEAEDIAAKAENKNFDQRTGGADMDALFSRTKDFVEQVRDEFPKIVLEGASSEFNSARTCYVNSNGVEFGADAEYYNISSMFSAKDGEKSSSFNGYGATLSSLAAPFMDLQMHRQLLEESVRSLDARMVDGKFVGKVIVTPACDDMIWGTLLHCFLNDVAPFDRMNPTSENLARHLAETIAPRLPPNARVEEIAVWESDRAAAHYRPPETE